MTPALATLLEGARVLLVRLRSLGDCVLTTPAIHLLKAHRPDLNLAVVVEDRFRAVFEGNPDIAAVFPPAAAEVMGWQPRLTVNFHGGPRSMVLTAASLAPRRAGFAHFPNRWLYNLRIPRAQEILGEERKVHTAEHLASAMFWLGVPRTEIPRAQLFAPASSPREPYAVIHPFASAPTKAWPAGRFVKVARNLPVAPVIIGAADDDFSPFSEFDCLRGAPLAEVMSLIAAATLFIGNDSGPAHIAAAYGRPVVVLYGSSDPVIWAPWRTESQVIEAQGDLSGVPMGAVLEAIDRLKVRA